MPLIRVNPVGQASASSAQSTKFIEITQDGTELFSVSDPIPVQGLPTIAVTFRMDNGYQVNEDAQVLCVLQGSIIEDPFTPANALYWFDLSNTYVLLNGASIDGLAYTGSVEQVITTQHALAFCRIRIQNIDRLSEPNIRVEAHCSFSQ